jgi:hypothetical protein
MTVTIGQLANVPAPGDDIRSPWAQDVTRLGVHTFATKAALDAAVWPGLVDGAQAWVLSDRTFWHRAGGAWISEGRPVLFTPAMYNAGQPNVGANVVKGVYVRNGTWVQAITKIIATTTSAAGGLILAYLPTASSIDAGNVGVLTFIDSNVGPNTNYVGVAATYPGAPNVVQGIPHNTANNAGMAIRIEVNDVLMLNVAYEVAAGALAGLLEHEAAWFALDEDERAARLAEPFAVKKGSMTA